MGSLCVDDSIEFECPICIRSFMCQRSTTGKRIDRLYRQFSISASDSNARIWLSFRYVVCGRFEHYLSPRNIGKC